MEDKYIIICRYEHWSSNGKIFTDWFACDIEPRTKKEAQDKIKEKKAAFGYIDKKTKLKHEYDVRLHSEYAKEIENIRAEAMEAAKKQKEYYASSEYKELQKKKRQAAKERKDRQKKYLEEHQPKDAAEK